MTAADAPSETFCAKDVVCREESTWTCKNMTEDDVCPGAFTLDCNTGDLDAQCGCAGQFW